MAKPEVDASQEETAVKVKDPEVKAIDAITKLLGALSPGARRRVVKWTIDRFDPPMDVPGDNEPPY